MSWGGHTRSLFSSLSCLCSRALFLRSSLPLTHALCVVFAYLLSSPLLFVWGTHTSSYSYACNLPPFSSSIQSFVLHSCRTSFLCVFSCIHRGGRRGDLATCIPAYGVRFPIDPSSSSRLGLVAFVFFRRPSLGVLAVCIHGMLCYLFFMSWTLCFLRRPRVSVSYCLLGSTRYLLYGARTLCFLRRPRVSVVFLMLSRHVTFALCLGLFVFCDAQE